MQWRFGRARGEGLASVGLGLGGGPAEGPRFGGAAIEALGAAARSVLCRRGWMGGARLGPHCGRIELAQFPKHRDERAILKAMGAETANLHLATAGTREDVLRDLGKRKPEWLHDAAQAMATATEQDWKAFRSAGEGA
jgi:hypothetical protein